MTQQIRYGKLPEDVSKYSETQTFTADTTPEALRREHRTKDGVWGLICIETGTLNYEILGDTAQSIPLKAGDAAVVVPNNPHRVTPGPDTSFKVEFYSRSKA